MKSVVCKSSLFKSTYMKNAFNEKSIYFVSSEDMEFYYIIDENKNEMNFAKENHGIFYFFDTYFSFVNGGG